MSDETQTIETTPENADTLTAEERKVLETMLEAGIHFGHKRSLWNPAMAPFVHTIRRNVFIIDVRKTEELLREALSVIEETVVGGGEILIVGTQPAAKAATLKFAQELGLPHVTGRWIGGTITNFSTISKRTGHLRDIEEQKETGKLAKYTKREQLEFSEEIERLNKKIGGIKKMIKPPALLIVMNVVEDDIAVREAIKSKIPVVGVVDTNANPSLINYPIPANDDVPSAVEYLLGRFRSVIETSQKRVEQEAAKKVVSVEKASVASNKPAKQPRGYGDIE